MQPRKRLSEMLLNSDRERLERAWGTTQAAADLTPIPPGEYRCSIRSGELFTAKSGTVGYKLTFQVIEGEHAGRLVWHDIWLSEAALPLAKRDLAKIGVSRLEQLERPLPDGIVLSAKIVLRREDDDREYNRVSRFEVVAIEPAKPNPFPPKGDPTDDEGFDWRTGESNGVEHS